MHCGMAWNGICWDDFQRCHRQFQVGKEAFHVTCPRKWLEISISLFVGANRWEATYRNFSIGGALGDSLIELHV